MRVQFTKEHIKRIKNTIGDSISPEKGTIASFDELEGDLWGPYPKGVVLVQWDNGHVEPINIHNLTDAED